MWDKSKIYGYTDEVMLVKWPEDNRAAKNGCNEILTREEIYRMFPNQTVVIEVCDYDRTPDDWITGKVLCYQCSLDYALGYVIDHNDHSNLLTYESTYSQEVIERWMDIHF